VSLPVYNGDSGDSGAPLLLNQTVGVGFNGLSVASGLIGVHCGGFNPSTLKTVSSTITTPIPVGIFIKSTVLQSIRSWKDMRELGNVFKAPWTSPSSHSPHASNSGWFEKLLSMSSLASNELDDRLWKRLREMETVVMIKVGVGRVWKFEFNSNRQLFRLTGGKRVFQRADSCNKLWSNDEDGLRFICRGNGTSCVVDAVFIFLSWQMLEQIW
jgi:hypothetical protein